MNKLKLVFVALSTLFSGNTIMAGGLLTNTNQSISFLRNPARDAVIDIDGVYSNPAGVVFLDNGFHLSVSLQNARQTRTVNSLSDLYLLGYKNNGNRKEFQGNAKVPVLPSLQAAYNTGNWSFQFGFAVVGGGGKCEFENGIPTFETAIAGISKQLGAFGAINPALGATGYDMQAYMQGRQYYFGFTFGSAYKINDNLSVYGGLRMLYGSASYEARVKDIKVNTPNGLVPFDKYIDMSGQAIGAGLQQVEAGIAQVQAGINQYQQAGAPVPEALTAQLAQLQATQQTLQGAEGSLDKLEPYRNGVDLMCDQTAWGVAPIIGIDYKTGNLNLAAKYEFKTRMRMKNKSTVKEASLISAVNKFQDGKKVPEDSPALLTVGAQYSIIPALRVSAGWHHYFDVDTKQFTKSMLDDSDEYLVGAEYDICKYVEVSAGAQRTIYDYKDEGMNDLSFNVSSTSVGFGVGVKVAKNVKVNAAYFHTFYDDYKKGADAMGVQNTFTRTNRVFGLGVDMKF